MRFETLRIIDSLLEDNVMKQQMAFDKCVLKLEQVKQEQAKNPEQEDYFEESYQFWKNSKKQLGERLDNANDALADFRSHKWG